MKRPTAPILALVVLLLVFSSVEGRVEVNSGIAVPHATDQRIPMKPLSLSLSLRRDVSSLQLSATPSARRGAPRRAPRIDASSTAACAAGTAAACPPAPTATRTSAPATGTRSPPIRRRSPSAHEHPPPPPSPELFSRACPPHPPSWALCFPNKKSKVNADKREHVEPCKQAVGRSIKPMEMDPFPAVQLPTCPPWCLTWRDEDEPSPLISSGHIPRELSPTADSPGLLERICLLLTPTPHRKHGSRWFSE